MSTSMDLKSIDFPATLLSTGTRQWQSLTLIRKAVILNPGKTMRDYRLDPSGHNGGTFCLNYNSGLIDKDLF